MSGAPAAPVALLSRRPAHIAQRRRRPALPASPRTRPPSLVTCASWPPCLPACSHYQVAGNFYWADDPSNPDYSPYAGNVKRATCQANTRDDWCSACGRQGATWACTACFPRMALHQKPVIRLDAASKRVGGGVAAGGPRAHACLPACLAAALAGRCVDGEPVGWPSLACRARRCSG